MRHREVVLQAQLIKALLMHQALTFVILDKQGIYDSEITDQLQAIGRQMDSCLALLGEIAKEAVP